MYDFTRKSHSIDRARDVLGYDPRDNSAHFDGEDRVAEPEP